MRDFLRLFGVHNPEAGSKGELANFMKLKGCMNCKIGTNANIVSYSQILYLEFTFNVFTHFSPKERKSVFGLFRPFSC